MTKYREILRLQSLGINQTGIAGSCEMRQSNGPKGS